MLTISFPNLISNYHNSIMIIMIIMMMIIIIIIRVSDVSYEKQTCRM